MNPRFLTAFLMAAFIGLSPVYAADHSDHAATSNDQAAAVGANGEAAPKLTLFPPRAGASFLDDGYVYLPFRVDNLTILPLYTEINGEETLKLKPRIGHLHIIVDDAKWSWIHALNDPVYFGPVPPGKHTIKVELVDSSHAVIETKTIEYVVPAAK